MIFDDALSVTLTILSVASSYAVILAEWRKENWIKKPKRGSKHKKSMCK